MITLHLTPGNRLRAEQSATAPFIYLDQWAFISLAKDHKQLQRFVNEIVRSEGTLAFSLFNFCELSQISDLDQLGRIENLFQQIWPRMAFLNPDPTAVIGNENELLRGTSNQAPHLDDWMLNKYVELYRPGVNPLDPKGFLLQLRNPGMAYRFQTAYRVLVEMMMATFEKLRCTYERDDNAKAEVTSSSKGEPVRHPTRYIFEQAVYSIVKDNLNIHDPNHIADFFHMVVPLSYCSLVLLDKGWAERARQVQNSVRNVGLLTHDAAVFSAKTLDQFWAEIERYCPSNV
jgi:hypothetical protein